MRRPSVWAASTWLLAAQLTLALAACAQAAGGDSATTGESEEMAPANTNPAMVDPEDAGQPVTDVPDVVFALLPLLDQGIFLGIGGVDHMPNPTFRVPLGSVVQVTLQNQDGAEYDIYFPDFEAKSERVVGRGSTTSLVFVAYKAGEFVYYSTVPGHREAGMEGRIIVGE